jgi:hypothetical protein
MRTAVALALLMALPAIAQEPRADETPQTAYLIAAIDAHPRMISTEAEQHEPPMIFTDETWRLHVVLSGTGESPTLPLPARDWTLALTIRIHDVQSGRDDLVSSRSLMPICDWFTSAPHAPGSAPSYSASFEFAPLRAGDYRMSAELTIPPVANQPDVIVRSQEFPVAVRRGDEDPLARRRYLQALEQRMTEANEHDYPRLSAILLELAELEPRDPTIWERLGDASVANVPPEETLTYLRRAPQQAYINLLEHLGKRDASECDTESQRRLASIQHSIAIIDATLAEYRREAGASVAFERNASTLARRLVIFRGNQRVKSFE